MGYMNQNIQKIDELLRSGMYEDAKETVTQLNSELYNTEENLYFMQLDDLHSLKDKIDSLSKLAEGLYVKEVAKVRTKRLARMLYAYKDLTE